MATSPPSGSDRSAAFERLHPSVQRWVWEQSWRELRDAQEAAVEPILAGDTDVIIAAATASGKTEAAFLPICSKLLDTGMEGSGVQVLYISPLKALINDQYGRLDALCERLELPVHRWHGDVPGSRKAKVLRQPGGVLLITPESLEALFVTHGSRIPGLFSRLAYVVVDELHSFIGVERGAQLQSLLHRLELALRRKTPRIGLSATLGDMSAAAEFLRPERADGVRLITSSDDGQELKLQLRGYVSAPPRLTDRAAAALEKAGKQVEMEDVVEEEKLTISEHLYNALHGTDNLIFANSRKQVETYADLLARICARRRVPNEFWPHHGSLSKELREHVEMRLKDRSLPINAVCTSTLEMGIDIGSVASIAQVGAPISVSSLRQRLGRSGRRGEAAVLRMYISEQEVTPQTPPSEALRAELVQGIAMVRLLLGRWYEPPGAGDMHLSTLVQQILSLVAQHGGVAAGAAHGALCGPGAFGGVDRGEFASLLRAMGQADLLMQAPDGTLLLGTVGERVVNHYSFYAAFATPEEYRLTSEGRNLGTLPIEYPLVEGAYLIFAGRRWRILSVDETQRVVDLARAAGGQAPRFGGTQAPVHDRVRREMLAVYRDDTIPGYLDATARMLLVEARDNFARYNVEERPVFSWGADSMLFLWAGDTVMNTVAVALAARGVEVGKDGLAISVHGHSVPQICRHLEALVRGGAPDGARLAATVANKMSEKYDWVLKGELLDAAYAARSLDPPNAWWALRRVLERMETVG